MNNRSVTGIILRSVVLIFLASALNVNAQTGPGGVEDTTGSSNLVLWLDANTINESNNTNLTSWEDQSGYENDASVSSGDAPRFQTNKINGYPHVLFDEGNNEYMGISDDNSLDIEEISAFVVGNITNQSDRWGGFFQKYNGAFDEGYAMFRDNNGEGIKASLNTWNNNDVDITVDYGTNSLVSLVYDKTRMEGYNDEGTVVTDNYTSDIDNNGNTLWIGWSDGYMDGDIAEIIIMDRDVNDAERIIISNYLAAKYALSLTNNDVYDADETGAGDYDHEVAGIGQASNGTNHTDAQGTGIVRMLSASNLGNDEFLMWGHDNGSISGASQTTDLPSTTQARLSRVWRVSESDVSGTSVDVGTVSVRFDLTGLGNVDASHLQLLVDSDKDGVFSDETPVDITATSVSGNVYQFALVSALTDSVRFTLGTSNKYDTPLGTARSKGPGGVTADLTLWLKADEGVLSSSSPITSGTTDEWENQADNSNFTSIDKDNGGPTLSSNGINYNPAIYFDGSDDNFEKVDFDADVLFSNRDNTIIYAFYKFERSGTEVLMGWEANDDSDRAGYFEVASSDRIRSDLFDDANKTMVGSENFSNSTCIASVCSNASSRDLFVNGISEDSESSGSMTAAGNNGDFSIGGRPDASNYTKHYSGDIIIYDDDLSSAELNRVESYLAVKYGVTLDNTGGGTDGDYTSSSGGTFWDASTGAGYHNQIVGIGRDDISGLYQKQSKTSDDSLIVYMSSLASDNATNSGTIANDVSYLMIGNNGGTLKGDEVELPTGITHKFYREWKVTNTNFADTFSLEIEWDSLGPFDISDIRLLVDDDGDFTDATVYGPSDGLTFSVGSIVIQGINNSHIPINTTRYISIGSVSASTPLPVELEVFKATPVKEENIVELFWVTASELNNSHFTVEKTQDMQEYDEVLEVSGQGTTNERTEYHERDYNPFMGVSYYRLSQTDFDGKREFFNIEEVNFDEQLAMDVELYPNPNNGHSMYMKIPRTNVDELQILVNDFLGKDFLVDFSVLDRQDHLFIALEMNEKLPPGSYMVNVQTQKGVLTHKLIVR